MLSAILSVKRNSMGKACSAVGCSNRFTNGSGVHFYRFPQDEERKSQRIQGRIQDFPKGGVETRDTKCVGGGGGGGSAVRFRPDTKSGGGGCCPLQARYKKRGGGRAT